MNVLVTGSAGFIGFFIARRLCAEGASVIGVDNLNSYYDVNLKKRRNALLEGEFRSYGFHEMDLADHAACRALFEKHRFDHVVHMAAQAGVRYSITNPRAYLECNLSGFLNVLECCRHHRVKHLVFASSSSVYGLNTKTPFSVHHNVDHPVSLYAATKKSNELMAHCYAHLYGIPSTGLRFFTVYGPWGRPDMAYFKFTDAIMRDQPIDVYNHGDMERDFTYIDDIVEGLYRVVGRIPSGDTNWEGANPDPGSSPAPYRIYNIGNNRPENLMRFIRVLERLTGREAKIRFLPMQPGDVKVTCADISDLARDTGYTPSTGIETGLREFVGWYRDYYGL